MAQNVRRELWMPYSPSDAYKDTPNQPHQQQRLGQMLRDLLTADIPRGLGLIFDGHTRAPASQETAASSRWPSQSTRRLIFLFSSTLNAAPFYREPILQCKDGGIVLKIAKAKDMVKPMQFKYAVWDDKRTVSYDISYLDCMKNENGEQDLGARC
jgi:hypothetical protein